MATTTIAKNPKLLQNKGKQLPVAMTAKEAALIAIDYFKEMRSLTKADSPNLSIDEVEFDGKTWKITIGFDGREGSPLFALSSGLQKIRQVITVDAHNRKVLSMKLHENGK